MTSTPPTGIVRCSESVQAAVESVFSALAVLEAAARARLSATVGKGRNPGTSDIAALRPAIQALLREQGERFNGAGVVMAPDALADAAYHLEWWQHRAGEKAPRPLRLNLDPLTESFYDYTFKPWFVIPRDEGHGTVMGPYVDLHCAGLYILTFTRPLTVHGEFVGVVGADVPMTAFEQIVVPPLKRLGGESVVITSEGRVLAANTPTWAVGEMARTLLSRDAGVERAAVRTPEVDWSVLRVLPPADHSRPSRSSAVG
ncbi:cache domain-containing protein [Streptomyces sp. NPDC002667]|uniref:cache domain-containing protein n=1 Tax=Streptomyces sp. NPDC002667 TaxID=3364657 RepID=UPI0036A6D05E